MISIFKTNIISEQELAEISPMLNVLDKCLWTIDLFDCDRILRVDSLFDQSEKIISMLAEKGFLCIELARFYTEPE